MREDFASNLRLLCGYYRSIAEVCRLLRINRSQFNKYLSASTLPSTYILRSICDFFGVEEYEIFLPHAQFAEIIQVRARKEPEQKPRRYVEHIDKLQRRSQGRFDDYLGFYYEIYFSMSFPGHILRNLVQITQQEGEIYYQRIERLVPPDGGRRVFHSRYQGMGFFLSDRIFLCDYESLAGNELTQTILYPTYKNRVSRLSGLRIGVAASDRHEPACVRVIYEYLGRRVDLRKALRRCGLFDADSPQIDGLVKSKIDNRVRDETNLFLAMAL